MWTKAQRGESALMICSSQPWFFNPRDIILFWYKSFNNCHHLSYLHVILIRKIRSRGRIICKWILSKTMLSEVASINFWYQRLRWKEYDIHSIIQCILFWKEFVVFKIKSKKHHIASCFFRFKTRATNWPIAFYFFPLSYHIVWLWNKCFWYVQKTWKYQKHLFHNHTICKLSVDKLCV